MVLGFWLGGGRPSFGLQRRTARGHIDRTRRARSQGEAPGKRCARAAQPSPACKVSSAVFPLVASGVRSARNIHSVACPAGRCSPARWRAARAARTLRRWTPRWTSPRRRRRRRRSSRARSHLPRRLRRGKGRCVTTFARRIRRVCRHRSRPLGGEVHPTPRVCTGRAQSVRCGAKRAPLSKKAFGRRCVGLDGWAERATYFRVL